MHTIPDSPFRKSSYSQATSQNCLEVADLPRSVSSAVRDSQHPEHGHLAFPTTEWTAFLHAVKQGEM